MASLYVHLTVNVLNNSYGKLKIKSLQSLNSYLTSGFLEQTDDWFHP
jgi:hypothetical protein